MTHTAWQYINGLAITKFRIAIPAVVEFSLIVYPTCTIYPRNIPWCRHDVISEESLPSVSTLLSFGLCAVFICRAQGRVRDTVARAQPELLL